MATTSGLLPEADAESPLTRAGARPASRSLLATCPSTCTIAPPQDCSGSTQTIGYTCTGSPYDPVSNDFVNLIRQVIAAALSAENLRNGGYQVPSDISAALATANAYIGDRLLPTACPVPLPSAPFPATPSFSLTTTPSIPLATSSQPLPPAPLTASPQPLIPTPIPATPTLSFTAAPSIPLATSPQPLASAPFPATPTLSFTAAPSIPLAASPPPLSPAPFPATPSLSLTTAPSISLAASPQPLSPASLPASPQPLSPASLPASPQPLARATLPVSSQPSNASPAKPSIPKPLAPATRRYWKTHPEAWPEPAKSSGLVLGSNPGVRYTQSQLITIMNTPVNGNGLVNLAYQLIAAKINLLLPPPDTPAVPRDVQDAIRTADAKIGNLVIPSIGQGYLATSDTSPLVNTLTLFNQGDLASSGGPIHCGTLP
ncbi:hypothetical protein ABPG77_009512 [Micractinium sp. CCAP 211/92]